jgi:SAM-dependent methyltransferase
MTTATRAQARYVQAVARLGGKNLPPGGRRTLERLLALLPEDARLLVDVGCNTGWVASEMARTFPAAAVVGIDVSGEMIAMARERHRAPNLRFLEADVLDLAGWRAGVDGAISAGSTAFFADRVAALGAIRRALRPGGVLADAHYVYDRGVDESLLARERERFGVVAPARSARECLAPYEEAGLLLRSYRREPRWSIGDHEHAALYRAILASVPELASAVGELSRAREVIAELAAHRHPVVVAAERGNAAVLTVSRQRLEDVMRVLEAFRTPIPPEPIGRLRSLEPYEFLAYVGDPDAAPGGAASVQRAAELLGDLGVAEDAAILDVGCFTGLSTFVLARSFGQVTGIDIRPGLVDVAAALGKALGSPATFRCMDGGATGLPAASLDAVVMTATLGYTPDPRRLLGEALRILRSGGRLVEFFYHYPVCTDAIRDHVRQAVGPDVRVSALSAQIDEVEQTGFQLVRCERIERTALSPDSLNALCERVTEAEHGRNPDLSDEDAHEFRRLFRNYVGRVRLGKAEPSAYLCAFAKPDEGESGAPARAARDGGDHAEGG